MVLSDMRLGCYLRPGRKGKLAGDHYSLVRFYAIDHSEVASLTLAGFHRTEIDSVIGFHHENKRPTLANLDGLCRNKRCVL